ncbi:MAG: SusF/SusE family outer membrane protein, partial [Muribaculaceae bacterium]|nr:SusF/SusE family outer membrane protein [Muribaculaceae bacterium]
GGQDLALAQPGQNFKVMVAGEYEVVVDPVNMKAYFTKAETPVVDELYIVGNFTGEGDGWDITQAEAMTAEDGKFTITKTFAAGDEFKLVGEKAWNDATTFGGQDDNNVGYFKVDDFLGGNITMVNPGANFKVEAAGEYKLVADKENKVLVVTGLNIPITDIVVPEQVTIALGGETYQIEAQVVPATATEGLTYTSSDEQVVTVDNTGLVTAVKSGTWEVAFRAPGIKEVQPATATVTVAADAVNATVAPVSKDIAFTVTNPTGVKNIGVAKTVASKKYVNAAGMVSDKAFDGMNIIVTTYSDGSREVVKMVK